MSENLVCAATPRMKISLRILQLNVHSFRDVAIGKHERPVRKASHCGIKQQ